MRINKVFSLLILIVALSSVPALAAETCEFRDGAISLTVSKSNQLYEYNDSVTYSPAGEPGYAYDRIFYDDNDSRMFSLYYVIFEENLKNDLSWSGELTEVAVEYLERFLNDEFIISISEKSDAVNIPGKMGDGWFRLECRDCEDGDSYVYVNITEKVFRVVIFEKYEDGTVAVIPQKSVESADKIVATIDDRGDYANAMFESCTDELSDWDPWEWDEDWDEDWGEYNDDVDGVIGVLILFIVLGGAYLVVSAIWGDTTGALKDRGKHTNASKQPEKPKTLAQPEKQKILTLPEKPKMFKLPERPRKRSKDEEIIVGDVDSRYLEDLKVLRKSGLITPDEYKEMVNKHRNGRARR